MKRKLIALTALLVTAVTLTGCGNTKTLTCTATENGEKETYTYKFSKDKLTKATIKAEMEAESEEQAQEYKKSAEEEGAGLFEGEGITTKVEVKGKKVMATIEMDIEKMSEEDKATVANKTYDEIKKEAEEDGYTCK